MQPPFDDLREQLLRAGIAPRHVCRYVAELRDPQAMIDRMPRSLTARAPWAVVAMFPGDTAAVCVLGHGCFVDACPGSRAGLAPAAMPGSYRGLISTVSFIATYLIGPLFLSGCMAIALRQRLSSRWIALGLALVAVFSAVFGFHMHEIPATGDRQAGAVFTMVDFVYLQRRVSVPGTLGLALLRASVLFALSIVAYRALSHRLVKV